MQQIRELTQPASCTTDEEKAAINQILAAVEVRKPPADPSRGKLQELQSLYSKWENAKVKHQKAMLAELNAETALEQARKASQEAAAEVAAAEKSHKEAMRPVERPTPQQQQPAAKPALDLERLLEDEDPLIECGDLFNSPDDFTPDEARELATRKENFLKDAVAAARAAFDDIRQFVNRAKQDDAKCKEDIRAKKRARSAPPAGVPGEPDQAAKEATPKPPGATPTAAAPPATSATTPTAADAAAEAAKPSDQAMEPTPAEVQAAVEQRCAKQFEEHRKLLAQAADKPAAGSGADPEHRG